MPTARRILEALPVMCHTGTGRQRPYPIGVSQPCSRKKEMRQLTESDGSDGSDGSGGVAGGWPRSSIRGGRARAARVSEAWPGPRIAMAIAICPM